MGGKGVRGVLYHRLSRCKLGCQWFTAAFFGGESVRARRPSTLQRRHLLFYCSYTPQKVIWELYYIGGVFFGASSFGRFGRRGKTPNLNQGVFTDTPCVTLSQQESVVASPVDRQLEASSSVATPLQVEDERLSLAWRLPREAEKELSDYVW